MKKIKKIKLSNINIPDYCTIDFSTEKLPPQFIRKILADNPTIYKTNKTVDGSEVYYYSRNTTNNWVLFGGFYWRIIRTNEDVSVSKGTWVNTGSNFYYGATTKLNTNKAPNYKCGTNTTAGLFETTQALADKFSASTTGGGNGQLTYGVALMTADEISFAGGIFDNSLSSPYDGIALIVLEEVLQALPSGGSCPLLLGFVWLLQCILRV